MPLLSLDCRFHIFPSGNLPSQKMPLLSLDCHFHIFPYGNLLSLWHSPFLRIPFLYRKRCFQNLLSPDNSSSLRTPLPYRKRCFQNLLSPDNSSSLRTLLPYRKSRFLHFLYQQIHSWNLLPYPGGSVPQIPHGHTLPPGNHLL